MLALKVETGQIRNVAAAIAILVFSGSAASASDMSGRFFTQDKQALSPKTVAVAGAALHTTRSTRLPVLHASDIPVIALPKSLRPTRPPAGSPL